MNASYAPRSRHVSVGVALAAGALLALSGCAAGQHAQTANEVPVVDGVGAQAGLIALRAVTVTGPPDNSYAAGGDATLQLVIVNQSHTNDQLVGVTTPAAEEVRLFADQADATLTAPLPASDTTSPGTASDSTSGTVSGTASDSTSSTPSDTASGTPSGTEVSTAATPTVTAPASLALLNLPAGHAVSIGYSPDLPVIQLHGLARQLFPAQAFPITFLFARSGDVTFTVAVHLAAAPTSRPSIDIEPTGEG